MNALTPDEVAVIQLSLTTTIEDHEAIMKNPTFPFTPEARALSRDLLKKAKSALAKIQLASGHAENI